MARPPYTSPTAWGLWEQCPRRWAKRYVEGQKDPGSVHTVHGKLVHQTLDWFMSQEPEHRTGRVKRSFFELALEDFQPEIAKVDADPVQVEQWASQCMAGVSACEPSAPFKADVLATEQEVLLEVDGVPVKLVVDRIDRRTVKAKGAAREVAVAIDYKAGAKPKVDEAKARQMILSAIAAEQLTGLPSPKAELWFVRVGEVREVRTGAQARETLREDLKRAWRAQAAAVIDDDFEPRTSALCAWCPYTDQCPEGARAARDYHERKARFGR